MYKRIATTLANRRKCMAHHERQAALIMLHFVNSTPLPSPSYTGQMPTAHSLMLSCSSHELVSDLVASSLLSEEM